MIAVRRGGAPDADTVLGLFDDAVRWLVARGQEAQWGSEPWSSRPVVAARVRDWAAGGGLRLAIDEPDGAAAGAIVLGDAPPYAPAPHIPEIYVVALVTGSAWRGRGVGAALLDDAAAEARAAGARRLRVDCWAGVPELPAAYERLGFVRTGAFEADGWPGVILERRI
jgi:GNAT superfamily N-acetyltransferase